MPANNTTPNAARDAEHTDIKTLRELVTPEQRRALRKVRVCPAPVKSIVYSGVTRKGGPGVTIQFHRDIQLYGLWEALLYVEGYEEKGFYVEGTARKALEAVVAPAGAGSDLSFLD